MYRPPLLSFLARSLLLAAIALAWAAGAADATGVTFGGASGTSFSVVNATTINVTTPAGAGQVDVVVQHPGGDVTLTTDLLTRRFRSPASTSPPARPLAARRWSSPAPASPALPV